MSKQGMQNIMELAKITEEELEQFNVAAKKLGEATKLSASQAAAFIRNFLQVANLNVNDERFDDVCEIIALNGEDTGEILKAITPKMERVCIYGTARFGQNDRKRVPQNRIGYRHSNCLCGRRIQEIKSRPQHRVRRSLRNGNRNGA